MILIRIAVIVTIVLAVLFAFLSIVGNYWIGSDNIHMGLWKCCFKKICYDSVTALAKIKVSEGKVFYKRSLCVCVCVCACVCVCVCVRVNIKFISIIYNLRFWKFQSFYCTCKSTFL